MFNIGFSELIVIGVIALIFIGPKQLPEIARTVGRFINELKRASDEAMGTFRDASTQSEDFIRKTREELLRRVSEEGEAPKVEKTQTVATQAPASEPPKPGGDSSDF